MCQLEQGRGFSPQRLAISTGYAEAAKGSTKEQSAIEMPIKGTPGERIWQGILIRFHEKMYSGKKRQLL